VGYGGASDLDRLNPARGCAGLLRVRSLTATDSGGISSATVDSALKTRHSGCP